MTVLCVFAGGGDQSLQQEKGSSAGSEGPDREGAVGQEAGQTVNQLQPQCTLDE